MTTAILSGLIVAHAAFHTPTGVLANYPERRVYVDGVEVAGYVALSDCDEIGRVYVLVRPGIPDVLVAVADCAQDYHVQGRQARGLIADVDTRIWVGPMREQQAELWRPADRAAYWRKWEAAIEYPATGVFERGRVEIKRGDEWVYLGDLAGLEVISG